ncbi:hypothetical protein [Niallia sp. BSM11]|uniref:hypothetical protein n=1 Tax=Niallia sp. BSM11 TaxID=3391576 RepID=UPI003985345C
MKKLLYSTVLLLSLFLSACGTDSNETSSVEKTTSTTESSEDSKVESDGQKTDKLNESTEEELSQESKDLIVQKEITYLLDTYPMEEATASLTPGDYPTSAVAEVNLFLDDDFPELMVLYQESGFSHVEFFRYDTNSKQWVSFYTNEPVDTYGGVESLMFLGMANFTSDGREFPLIGSWAGSGGFLGFQIFGAKDHTFGKVMDELHNGVSDGTFEIDASEEKINFYSGGQLAKTVKESDLDFTNMVTIP